MPTLWIIISLFSILVFSSIIINSISFSLPSELMNNKTSIFGCEISRDSLHCDQQKNEIVGLGVPQKSKVLSNITREPIYVNGKYDKAIEFNDKYREYVEIPQNNLYNSPQFSISFWIKKTNGTEQASPHAHIISHSNSGGKNGWFFDTNSSHDQSVRFTISTNATETIKSGNISISNSSFTQITATFDGSHIGVYKNGNLFEMINYHGNYSAPHNIPIHIGSASYCDSCERFTGIVDDVRLYNHAISSDQVKQLYFDSGSNATKRDISPINKGLIGHWTFDNTLEDSSPIKNAGQMFTLLASMVTAPDGRTFISEKNTGKIAIMKDEKILEKPFAILNDSYVHWEQGLLGLAIDPKFVDNHFVYLYYTAIDSGDNPVNRIVRFTDKDNVGTNMTVIFDNIPASHGYHSGGAMAFGPDDKLYITVGDALNPLLSQSESELSGKILRINSDGSIPKDNPFPDSPVYTLGHRNMFGIAFDDKDNIGIVTENGDIHYDEINLIKKGGNYGYPTMQIADINPQLSNSTLDIKPLRSYWNTPAPTQAIYYTGDRFPNLKNTFLFGTYTGQIYSVHIDNYSHIIDSEEHIQINQYPFESVIGITQSPNSDIYYGAYHIYKLENVNENQTTPILFPLSLNYSKNIVLDNVQAKIGKYIIIDLHNNDNSTSANIPSQYLKLKLPKSLIEKVGSVNASIISSQSKNNKQVIPFFSENKSLKYNDITIPINFKGTKIQIMINSNNLSIIQK